MQDGLGMPIALVKGSKASRGDNYIMNTPVRAAAHYPYNVKWSVIGNTMYAPLASFFHLR